jgi:hypothetical protein
MVVFSGFQFILRDHISPYQVGRGNATSIPHISWVLGVPFFAAIAGAFLLASFVTSNPGGFIAVYAMMASILTAIMPTIHSLVGNVTDAQVRDAMAGDLNVDADRSRACNLIARVEVVRGLFASVGWSVVVLAASLIPLIVMTHPKFPSAAAGSSDWIWWVLEFPLSALVLFAGATALVSLVQIISGVHLVLRHGQVELENQLKLVREKFGG